MFSFLDFCSYFEGNVIFCKSYFYPRNLPLKAFLDLTNDSKQPLKQPGGCLVARYITAFAQTDRDIYKQGKITPCLAILLCELPHAGQIYKLAPWESKILISKVICTFLEWQLARSLVWKWGWEAWLHFNFKHAQYELSRQSTESPSSSRHTPNCNKVVIEKS